MDNEIFKSGDKVYVYLQGWGEVIGYDRLKGVIVKYPPLEGKSDTYTRTWDEAFVSFTEYNPVDGGLIHERDYAIVGKWCKIWDENDQFDEYIRIAIVSRIESASDYKFMVNGSGYEYAVPLEDDLVKLLIKQGIINGNNGGDSNPS